jgi:hypothetical protein
LWDTRIAGDAADLNCKEFPGISAKDRSRFCGGFYDYQRIDARRAGIDFFPCCRDFAAAPRIHKLFPGISQLAFERRMPTPHREARHGMP